VSARRPDITYPPDALRRIEVAVSASPDNASLNALLATRLREHAEYISDGGTRRTEFSDDLRAAADELDRLAADAENADAAYRVVADQLAECRVALHRAEAIADPAREYVAALDDSDRGVWRCRAKSLADCRAALVAAVEVQSG